MDPDNNLDIDAGSGYETDVLQYTGNEIKFRFKNPRQNNATYEFLYAYCKDNKKRLIIKQPTTGASKTFSKPHQIITLSRMSNLWLYQF